MSVNTDWVGHRSQLIHANFIDHWDWSDVHQALTNAQILSSKSGSQATVIFDFLGSVKLTTKAIKHPQQSTLRSQIGRFVIVLDEVVLAQDLVKLLQELYPKVEEILTVSSYEEAFDRVLRNHQSEN